jgi:NhaP-type Na+/H+ or K+/H+ antiporter
MTIAITAIVAVLMGGLVIASIDAQSLLLNTIGIGFLIGLLAAALMSQSSKIDYNFTEHKEVTLALAVLGSFIGVVCVLFFFHQI